MARGGRRCDAMRRAERCRRRVSGGVRLRNGPVVMGYCRNGPASSPVVGELVLTAQSRPKVYSSNPANHHIHTQNTLLCIGRTRIT